MSNYSYVYIYYTRRDTMENKQIDIASCCCNIIHQDVVNRVKGKMHDESSLYDLAELFNVFGDITRLKILNALFESEMCVCDIAALLGMNQSAISHQLKVLKQTRLVKYRRDGKIVYYSLDDEHIQYIFDLGLVHVKEK
jgi:ArsR family transcriptional regulator, lead/cadmium/zinc/bismuth-responsive transcriptional repressor